MDNSLRETLLQMVNLQAQSLDAINKLNSTVQSGASNTGTPPASALTSYTNYASSYQSQANPFSPTPQASARFNAYSSQVAPSGMGTSLKDYITQNTSQISQEQRNAAAARFGSNVTNAGIAGVGAVASGVATAASFGLMPGLVGSTIAGSVAGPLAGAVTSVALDQSRQSSAYNNYLLQNSYRFINPVESSNDRGVGGFSQSQRWQAATYLRHADSQSNISSGDVSSLLKGFTEGGLLKDTSDLKSFESNFKALTAYVKQASITLNTSYTQTTELISDMQKRGILAKDANSITNLAKVVGSMTGTDALTTASSITGIASGVAAAGTSVSMTKASATAAGTINIMDNVYTAAQNAEKAGTATPYSSELYNTISNLGGSTAAANQVTSATGNQWSNSDLQYLYTNLAYDSKTGTWSSDKWNQATSGKTYEQLVSAAKAKESDFTAIGQKWYENKGKASSSYLENSVDSFSAYAQALIGNVNTKNGTNYDLEQGLTTYMGFDQGTASALSGYNSADKAKIIAQQSANAARQNFISAANSNSTSIATPFINLGKEIGAGIGDKTQPINEWATGVGQFWSDVAGSGAFSLLPSGVSYSDGSVSSRSKTAIDTLNSISNGTTAVEIGLGGRNNLTDTASALAKRIAEIQKTGKNSDQLNSYMAAQTDYSNLDSEATGFIGAGRILADKTGLLSKMVFGLNYGDKSKWTAKNMADKEAGGTEQLADSLMNSITASRDPEAKAKQYLKDTGLDQMLSKTDQEKWVSVLSDTTAITSKSFMPGASTFTSESEDKVQKLVSDAITKLNDAGDGTVDSNGNVSSKASSANMSATNVYLVGANVYTAANTSATGYTTSSSGGVVVNNSSFVKQGSSSTSG